MLANVVALNEAGLQIAANSTQLNTPVLAAGTTSRFTVLLPHVTQRRALSCELLRQRRCSEARRPSLDVHGDDDSCAAGTDERRRPRSKRRASVTDGQAFRRLLKGVTHGFRPTSLARCRGARGRRAVDVASRAGRVQVQERRRTGQCHRHRNRHRRPIRAGPPKEDFPFTTTTRQQQIDALQQPIACRSASASCSTPAAAWPTTR